MIEGYKSLIIDDKLWKEPGTDELARMTADQKAAYWVYHLRDVGGFDGFGSAFCGLFFSEGFRDDATSPARSLKALGVAAIPQVIAHLDDTRPARAYAIRNRWSGELYTLHYGDCCRQVFEAITGHTVYDGLYPVEDGKGKECKATAGALVGRLPAQRREADAYRGCGERYA